MSKHLAFNLGFALLVLLAVWLLNKLAAPLDWPLFRH
jgi:hypothetical protein